jgi:hypothetical protein
MDTLLPLRGEHQSIFRSDILGSMGLLGLIVVIVLVLVIFGVIGFSFL